MDFNYESMYAMDDELATVFGIVYIIYYLFVIGLGIAGYVLSSLGLYTIAKRRGITNPWLAWIPVASSWIVGSISDQFRYVTRGQIKNKRKILLALSIATVVAFVVFYAVIIVGAIGMSETAVVGGGEAALTEVFGLIAGMLGMALVIGGISIALLIVHYMAMYDLYSSVNPAYSVLFLVLSIIFNVTEPYFIFFNRKKDFGMPPRCEIPTAPAAAMPQPVMQEPWENNPQA